MIGWKALRNTAYCTLAIASGFIFTFPVTGQTVNRDRLEWANLKEDVAMLRREVSQLRLEIERIARENAELKRSMNVRSSVRERKVDSYITMDELNKVLSSLRNDLNSADSKQRIEIVAEVSMRAAFFPP